MTVMRTLCPLSFNAARGFVGGATWEDGKNPSKEYVFQCRTRLCGWCSGKAYRFGYTQFGVSMPHAALWVVQRSMLRFLKTPFLRFNAARGFVGGAAHRVSSLVRARKRFNAARGFVGGAANLGVEQRLSPMKFQCRTRLCGWCSTRMDSSTIMWTMFQCRTRLCGWCSLKALDENTLVSSVSMPHAALWVVQQN